MTVYFMQRRNGDIKIGKTVNLTGRLGCIRSEQKEPVTLLGIIDGYSGKEEELHERFSDFRVKGEWFLPSPELLEYIAIEAKPVPELELPKPKSPRKPRRQIERPPQVDTRPQKTNHFFKFWKEEELRRGEPISVADVAKVTGLHRETVNNMLLGRTTRFDAPVVDKLCEYFNLPPGPVPFIVYERD